MSDDDICTEGQDKLVWFATPVTAALILVLLWWLFWGTA